MRSGVEGSGDDDGLRSLYTFLFAVCDVYLYFVTLAAYILPRVFYL